MLTMTRQAAEAIRTLLKQTGAPSGAGLRISMSDSGSQAGIKLAAGPQSGDLVVAEEGARLFVAPEAASAFDDQRIDADMNDNGSITFSAATATTTASAEEDRSMPGTTMLRRLRDTGQTIANPIDDIRGRTVTDAAGDELGTVEDLLVDDEQGKVRLLHVEHGGLLGIGASHAYIPVEAVTRVTPDEVQIDQTLDRVASAAQYSPEIVDEASGFEQLYGYYGYSPFWFPGAADPAAHRSMPPAADDGQRNRHTP